MKRYISVVLMLVIILNSFVPVLAVEGETELEGGEQFSYVDLEGKTNTIITYFLDEKMITEHYIDGMLVNTVEGEIVGEQIVMELTNASSGEKETINRAVPEMRFEINAGNGVSTYVSYMYAGKITYNTYYDNVGNSFNNSLYVFTRNLSTYETFETVNEEAGIAVGFLVTIVGTALTLYCPALQAIANNLVGAILLSAGISTIDGKLVSAISHTYYVEMTDVEVKAQDSDSARYNLYSGERYRVRLPDGSFTSTYYYDEYLPWNSNTVAYWMFTDFWSYTYPGVYQYS